MAPREPKPRLRLTVADSRLVDRIIERLVAHAIIEDTLDGRIEARRLLAMCHLNGCPLNLRSMAEWPRIFDVGHDYAGLVRHLNRGNGELLDCFCPRFALSVADAKVWHEADQARRMAAKARRG